MSELSLNLLWIQVRLFIYKTGYQNSVPVLAETQNYPLLLQYICQQLGNQTTIQQGDRYYEISGVEVDTDDLDALRLTLQPDSPFPKSINRAIHALFFSMDRQC